MKAENKIARAGRPHDIRPVLIAFVMMCLFCSAALAFKTGNVSLGTVTDEETGLMWQSVDDGKTYNWFEAAGIQNATFNPSGKSVCGDLKLAGYTNWRLPTRNELLGIVDDSVLEPGPKIDAEHFPNTKPSVYWSSTSGEGNPGAGFGVVFRSGNVFIGNKGVNRWYVRCVRLDLQDAFTDAAGKGDVSSVQVLLARGANINGRGGYRNGTALMQAAVSGSDEVVKLLLAKGADPNVRDNMGVTALIYAAARPDESIVKLLLDGGADANINVMDSFGGTALTAAVRRHDAAIVKMLLAKGADVNARNQSGESAWSMAMESGYQDLAGILRKAGAKEAWDALTWSGEYSEFDQFKAMVITNPRTWGNFWRAAFRGRPVPDIDFTRYIAVCVFLGTRPTGGYVVNFGTPYVEGDRMVIPFKERKPTGFVTEVLTQPFGVRIFDRKDNRHILLKKEEKIIEPVIY